MTARRLILLLVCVALAAVAVPAQRLHGAPATLAPASSEAVLRHAAVLSRDIGSRAAGEPGYLRAVEYVEGVLRDLGYAVERQAFPFLYFLAREVRVQMVAPQADALAAAALYYSAATPPGGVAAPLAHVGLGRPEETTRTDLRGRVALIERGQITFREKVQHAAAAGAVAALIYDNRPGPLPAATLLEPSTIPAVIVSQTDGARLVDLLARGDVRVHLVVDTVVETRTTWNVIGRHNGRQPRTVVIGGHLDSVAVSPGANDNASGVAATLEAARLLSGQALEFSVEIVAFGAEEVGLLGSEHYVAERGAWVAGMVNMDMVGRGPLMVGNAGGSPALVDLAGAVAARWGWTVDRFRLGLSDHVPFERAGIPTVFIHTGNDPAIHSPQDTLDRLDPERMAQAARLAAAVALEAAGVVR